MSGEERLEVARLLDGATVESIVNRVVSWVHQNEHRATVVNQTNSQLESQNFDGDRGECKICMDQKIDAVLIECGHMVACVKCASVLHQCPICRSTVKRWIKIYQS